ncbi:MAG: UvrD-helicase domain-containing protein [Elusimicrobia bacterium]|nr:UvrD-helicase domain-containing protein [Elusimicrobiota bacterium]
MAPKAMDDDRADRDQARFELRKNIVVEAGAGTGKTTLLTDRIVYTLLAGGQDGGGVPLDKLVALTFTNKAAGEIKSRVLAALLDLLSPDDVADERRRREAAGRLLAAKERFGLSEREVRASSEKAVEGMDRALIGTIHHFAAHLLRLHPVEAGVDPSFEVDMGEGAREHVEAEWRRWTSVELGEGAPRREAWLEVLRLASLEDCRELAMTLCSDVAGSGRVGATKGMEGRARLVAAAFEPLLDIKADPGRSADFPAYLRVLSGRLGGIVAAADGGLALPDKLTLPPGGKRPWPKAWRGVPGREAFEAGRDLALLTAGAQEALVRKAVALVRPFADGVRRGLARKGLVSNEGLIIDALSLVRGDAAVRERLKASFEAVLVDEFQDTDPLQGEILLFLSERPGESAARWRDIRLEQGKLFVVGDPKQSIYRFRGADMRAYDGFKDLLLAQGARRCALRQSFRGSGDIVGFVNGVMPGLMTAREGVQPAYVPIAARPVSPAPGSQPRPRPDEAAGEAGVELALVGAGGKPGGRLRAAACRGAEARWIAEWIGRHRGPALPCKDIAILMRTTTHLAVYLQALKDAGIPYAVEADRYFYGTQEILDFTNLLRVLDDPGDQLALVGVMRSPLLGLDDREILALRRADRLSISTMPSDETPLAPASRERLAAFAAMARRLRAVVGREPLDDLIGRVLNDTFLLELCSAAYHHEQTASNLMKYRRLARAANDAYGATLKDFVAAIERSVRDDSAQEGESPLADEHFDAVRILSIHKAKGLEFGAVIIPNLGGPRPGRNDRPARLVDWGSGTLGLRLTRKARAADLAWALIKLEEDERIGAEGVRLLYVAMTRAKDRLVLVGDAVAGGEGSFSGLLERGGAWPKEARSSQAQAPAPILGGRVAVTRVDAGLPDAAPRATERRLPGPEPAAPAAAASLDLAALAARWEDRYGERERVGAEGFFAAPTAYLREADKAALEDEAAGGARPWRKTTRARGEEAALVGEVCHRVLERWDYRGGGDLRVLAEAATNALARRRPPADWAWVREEAARILASFLSSPAAAELAACEILGRELGFVYPEGGKVVRGSIDLLYRQDGRLWVADYKTESRGRERAALAGLYRRQGAAYVQAVAKARGEAAGFRLIFLREGGSVAVIEPCVIS